ncbi:MAG: gamma-glutamyl-gamma-aminobutyrate hydrolase family protein [Blautia sp.]|nr:gamma-glutamyl-gamma-aminobutyrate hydrolase family protein [Blautia sp.]MDY5032802.1 gamma-glutamyl-gamma-aminobutyrate hydrolase family protein [Blautia sp.]
MRNVKKAARCLWMTMLMLVLIVVLSVSADAASLNRSAVKVRAGSSVTISMQKLSKNKKVAWSSSNPNIALVKAKGQSAVITGIRTGNVTVTARVDKQSYKCLVMVEPKIKLAIAWDPAYGQGLAASFRALGAGVYAVNARSDISDYDGLILPGGGDISPARYNEKNNGSRNIDNATDNMQFAVLDKFVRAKKPVLGVCKGHQIINVYFGGSLYQDIRGHMAVWHTAYRRDSSILFDVCGKSLSVLSFHHQSVKRLGRDLEIIQTAAGGTVEAIQHRVLPVYGVQYHPEGMGASGQKILKQFLNICACHRRYGISDAVIKKIK